MPDFYQYPPPFELPEAATIAGKTFTGTRARVYWLLKLTAERRHTHRVGKQAAPAGWVPRFLLVEPWSGGQQGDRRLRELRLDYGLDIEMRMFEPPNGGTSSTTLWRLVSEDGARREEKPQQQPERKAMVGADALAGVEFWTEGLLRAAQSPHGAPGSTGAESGAVGARSSENPPIAELSPFGRVLGEESRLAPSSRLVQDSIDRAISPFGADERYRDELLELWASGDLVREVLAAADEGPVLVAFPTYGDWSPLTKLEYALRALGAKHLGRRRRAA